jgi:hypothetical protein
MEQQLITFVDHIGRTLIGLHQGDTEDRQSFLVKNPAIIHVQPTQNGQLNVQTIPLYFREFVGEKCKVDGTTWKFHYSSVVLGIDVDNDARLVEQYHRLFAPAPAATASTNSGDKVVKLFDE